MLTLQMIIHKELVIQLRVHCLKTIGGLFILAVEGIERQLVEPTIGRFFWNTSLAAF